MHMADALVSPVVGGAMWAAAAGLASYAAKKNLKDLDDRKVPLMGILGAFVFSAQMINFAIPGTGSSGHLGGGLILAILLGPYAGFLTMASILTIQALFFADGGLLALGCNIINLGFFPCLVIYPLVYKKIVGNNPNQSRLLWGIMLAAIAGLQLGALGVVAETSLSGITELPFQTFLLLMLPIHLAIGIAEGLITTAVVLFIWKERPEIITAAEKAAPFANIAVKPVLIRLLITTLFIGGILSWFASAAPDGLEWSIQKTASQQELAAPEGLHSYLAAIQQKLAFFPDYNFKNSEPENKPEAKPENAAWPNIDKGTSVAGLIGSGLTLLLVVLIGKGCQLAFRRN